MSHEFAFPVTRWLLKSWFLLSAFVFAYLFWVDVFVHRWFVGVWVLFSLGLAFYVAPAIRLDAGGLSVKYLWRYRPIPWQRVLAVQRTALGAQILTSETHLAYRVVSYQFPMPGVDDLVEAVRASMGGVRRGLPAA